MNKKDLNERDICTKFITPAVIRAGWDVMSQVRQEVSFTKGRRNRFASAGVACCECAPSSPTDRKPIGRLLSFPRHHRVEETILGQALVAFDARIAERGVFVATECEDCLVHLLGVEHSQPHEQVEVLYCQAGDD